MSLIKKTGEFFHLFFLVINGEKVMSIHKMIHLVSVNELTEEEILKSIEEGIDTDIKAERGLTPLMAACRWGCMKVVKKLVELGKDVNETSAHGCSSLHYACLGWHPEIIKFLLKNKADVNKESIAQQTPLHILARSRNEELILILLEAGADIHKRDFEGKTPFLTAVTAGNYETAKLLFEKGAKGYKKDKAYQKTMTFAVMDEKMVQLLKKAYVSKPKKILSKKPIPYNLRDHTKA